MDKFTFITGASGGLGKAFCVECAKRGQNLFMTDIAPAPLLSLSENLKSTYGIMTITAVCDLASFEERQYLFNTIEDSNIELNMAINVAGLDYEGGIETLDSSMISTVIRLNTEATLDITRFVVCSHHTQDFYIINVASMAGFYSMPLKAMYAASKRAIIQFSLAIREEIKCKGGHVMALCPAGLRTMPEVIASIDSQGFMGRVTTIDTGKVAHITVKKALSNKSKYIPGAINMILVTLSKLIPDMLKAKLIYKRWSASRRRAADCQSG